MIPKCNFILFLSNLVTWHENLINNDVKNNLVQQVFYTEMIGTGRHNLSRKSGYHLRFTHRLSRKIALASSSKINFLIKHNPTLNFIVIINCFNAYKTCISPHPSRKNRDRLFSFPLKGRSGTSRL